MDTVHTGSVGELLANDSEDAGSVISQENHWSFHIISCRVTKKDGALVGGKASHFTWEAGIFWIVLVQMSSSGNSMYVRLLGGTVGGGAGK
jgi:hypothetical protein